MVIIELKERIPTVTGYAQSMGRKTAEEHLDTTRVTTAKYQGSPVWCREDEANEIEQYWDGMYTDPDKHFT